MGLFSFFFGHDEHMDDKERSTAVDAASRAARTLDIEHAIQAHALWKHRLQDVVHGKSHEQLHADQVCDAHRCALGQWIYSDGESHLGQYATFHNLRDTHQRFHNAAGEVLRLASHGRTEDAEKLLHGEFDKLSKNVNKRLSDLKALA